MTLIMNRILIRMTMMHMNHKIHMIITMIINMTIMTKMITMTMMTMIIILNKMNRMLSEHNKRRHGRSNMTQVMRLLLIGMKVLMKMKMNII